MGIYSASELLKLEKLRPLFSETPVFDASSPERA